ncbi:MAG: DUF1987 domain-containing protein [Pseudomonadota bacterium]
MERLVLKPTVSTLGVDFDPLAASLVMRGESYPENALAFFTPIIAWLETYLADLAGGEAVRVDLDIVYFNSSSSKVLMNIFDLLEEAAGRGIKVTIIWRHHVENEIALECGQEFAEELTAAAFEIEAYED